MGDNQNSAYWDDFYSDVLPSSPAPAPQPETDWDAFYNEVMGGQQAQPQQSSGVPSRSVQTVPVDPRTGIPQSGPMYPSTAGSTPLPYGVVPREATRLLEELSRITAPNGPNSTRLAPNVGTPNIQGVPGFSLNSKPNTTAPQGVSGLGQALSLMGSAFRPGVSPVAAPAKAGPKVVGTPVGMRPPGNTWGLNNGGGGGSAGITLNSNPISSMGGNRESAGRIYAPNGQGGYSDTGQRADWAQGMSPSQMYDAVNDRAHSEAIANSANPSDLSTRDSLAEMFGFA